jgi:hypothetical protein
MMVSPYCFAREVKENLAGKWEGEKPGTDKKDR